MEYLEQFVPGLLRLLGNQSWNVGLYRTGLHKHISETHIQADELKFDWRCILLSTFTYIHLFWEADGI